MPVIESSRSVGQLVAERPSRARLFEQYGIDYCCGGGRSLEEACARRGLEVSAIIGALEIAELPAGNPETDWLTASLVDLADHIETTHHDYLRQSLPRLSGLIDKVLAAHGDGHPELATVREVFAGMRSELESHTAKEEMVLFPIIRSLEIEGPGAPTHCGYVHNIVHVMEMEHQLAGGALEQLSSLTNGYTAPEGACNTYRAMLDGLAELEADLHLHIHKENNILFPRAIALESGAEE